MSSPASRSFSKYTTILNYEQRQKYKAEFNADYEEYKKLHAIIAAVARRFAVLESKLRKEEKTSLQYKIIKMKIYNEYCEVKKDEEYQKSKPRCLYLHEKLSHIKQLISNYDECTTKNQSGSWIVTHTLPLTVHK